MSSSAFDFKKFAVSLVKFLLFFAVGFGILYFVYQNQEAAYQKECSFKLEYDCNGKCVEKSLLGKLFSDFASADIFWLFMVCVAFMISNLSRALRWNMLIRQLEGGKYNPKWYNAFLTIMIGYFVNLALPRAGEFARPASMSQYEKLPLDKLIGTIVTDRIMDVLMLLLVLGITFLLQFQNIINFLNGSVVETTKCNLPVPEVSKTASLPIGTILLVLFLLGLITLLILISQRKKLMKLSIYKKIEGMVLNFAEGIKTIFTLRKKDLVWFWIHTVIIWLMYFTMTYLSFFAYKPTIGLDMTAALLVFAFGTLAILIPSPGGMGTHQLATTAALVVCGIAKADAFAFANIMFFTVNFFCSVIFGLLAYMLLPILNSKRKSQ